MWLRASRPELAILSLVATLSWTVVDAFLPHSISGKCSSKPLTTTTTTHSMRVFGRAKRDARKCTGSSTLLTMGVLEDFITGKDSEKRKQLNDSYLAKLQERVQRINTLESSVEELGDDELAGKTVEFKKRLTTGEDLNGVLLEEAFAVVREASW